MHGNPVTPLLAFTWLTLAAAADAQTPKQEDQDMSISNGDKVSIEYTLKLEDGTVATSNVDGEALVYTQGEGEILPALETALIGMEEGDTKTVKLEPGEAFGPVLDDAYQSVPKEQVPENARKPGSVLVLTRQDGQQQQIRVHEVGDDEVVIDLNHPLAGKDLVFDVKILSVQ